MTRNVCAERLRSRAIDGFDREEHRPPKDHHQHVEELRKRFQELGEIALCFLEGLLQKQRYGKRQAQRVLALASAYHRQDVLAAMERAVRYHAYSLSSLERILNTATPKASWQVLSENQQELMRKLTNSSSIEPRSSAEYQYLLFDEKTDPDGTEEHERPNTPDTGPPASDDTQHPPGR